jgi:hypothetical protein
MPHGEVKTVYRPGHWHNRRRRGVGPTRFVSDQGRSSRPRSPAGDSPKVEHIVRTWTAGWQNETATDTTHETPQGDCPETHRTTDQPPRHPLDHGSERFTLGIG